MSRRIRHDTAPLSLEHLHAVDAQTVRQTIAESEIDSSIDMGAFSVHHGSRDGARIVIVEHHNQRPDELSAVWFNDGQ